VKGNLKEWRNRNKNSCGLHGASLGLFEAVQNSIAATSAAKASSRQVPQPLFVLASPRKWTKRPGGFILARVVAGHRRSSSGYRNWPGTGITERVMGERGVRFGGVW